MEHPKVLYLACCRRCSFWIGQEDPSNFKSRLQAHMEKSHGCPTSVLGRTIPLNEFRENFGIIIEKNQDRIQTFEQSWIDNSFFEGLRGQRCRRKSETEERIAERGRYLARELKRQMSCIIKEPIRIQPSSDKTEKEKASLALENMQQVERNEFLASIHRAPAKPPLIKTPDTFF